MTLSPREWWFDELTRRPALWAWAIMAASLTVRLWFAASGQLDLVQDEAQYWDWSRRLQWSYYSKGPLIAWLIALWTHIFGPTELGVRVGAVVNASLAQIMLWYGLGLALCVAIFSKNALPAPPELNPATRLKGWADLGDKLDELTQGLPNSDKVFYFGEGYDVTAELAFYAPGQPTAYSADFGRRRSQYNLWPGPDEQGDNRIGWDAIFVSTGDSRPGKLYDMFDSVTFFPYQSTHRGKPGRLFTIALPRNFNGNWPHSSHAQY